MFYAIKKKMLFYNDWLEVGFGLLQLHADSAFS